MFDTLEDMIAQAAAGVRPPERLTVDEAAPKIRYLNNPGSYVGMWDNDLAPYLKEPMEVLTSTDYTGMALAGPARCGKSDLVFNWMGHTAIYDPSDMMVVAMTMSVARDWSQKDLRRVFRHSKKIGKLVAPGRHNMSTHDIRFLSGMHLLVKWPTITELSGKTVRYNWLMDYDRMPEDIDGEGNGYDLTAKRAETFRRNGMTVAESSPGYPIILPEGMDRWVPKTPHEAPPTKGILSLYNRGDRRRWYWKCPHCAEAFEPAFKLLHIPKLPDMQEAARKTMMGCPHCGGLIPHDRDKESGLPGKHDMNLGGRWIKDGQRWLRDGSVVGTPVNNSTMASFWLKGTAAAFVDWSTLVMKYLMAEDEFERTGSQSALKTTINIDQGEPFSPRGIGDGRLPEDVKALCQSIGQRVVPPGVRFLVATVDVQANRFECQVHGIGRGFDIYVIDRFAIRKSARLDEDGDPLPVRPDSYPEDWLLLIDQLMMKEYPLGDDSGRTMAIRMTGCDSGGSANKRGDGSVTANAYNLYRYLRDDPDERLPNGLFRRFQLLKGASTVTAPRIKLHRPDSERNDRFANARGEIPVLFMNGNMLKDQLDGILNRTQPETGRLYFSEVLEDWFYGEMTAEVKTEKGWMNPRKLRNEAWDLIAYVIAICLHNPIRIEHLDWDDPPNWADEWEMNPMVRDPEVQARIDERREDTNVDWSELAAALA